MMDGGRLVALVLLILLMSETGVHLFRCDIKHKHAILGVNNSFVFVMSCDDHVSNLL